jgi:vancomycin permeability regulator SanA
MSVNPRDPSGDTPLSGSTGIGGDGSGTLFGGIFRDLARLFRVFRRGWETEEGFGDSPRVAVVLGAQVLPGGRASQVLDARVRHAARLYSEGEVDLLIVTGGTGEYPPSEAEVMMGILRRDGVPEEVVVLEDQASSTWASARLVAEIARRHGIEAVRVVTDPLHCVRTIEAFGEAGLRAVAEPVYGSPMWRGRISRREQLARESVAVVWYRTRHGVGSRSQALD